MKPKTSIIQNPLTASSWRSCLQLWIALAILCWSSLAHAQGYQTDTWNGGGANANWTTTNNWSPITGMTTNGDDLIFTGSTQLGPVNNFTGLQIDSITYGASGFVVTGNALTITNGITDNSGSNTLSTTLTLGASQTFQNTVSGTTNTVGGTVALDNGVNLTLGGSGDVFLNGIVSATNGGTLTVNNSGIARLGPTSGSPPNAFGSNTVVFTITATNTTYFTNVASYVTNTYVLVTNGVSTNTVTYYVTNNVITTNNAYTYVTNGIFGVTEAVAIQSGTLQLGGAVNGNHIPNGTNVGNVLDNGTLDLNGLSETVNGLDGGGVVDNVSAALTGTYTLTVGNANSNGVFSGVIQNTAGSVALTKIGFGTETLGGGNTYSGLTTVSQGTLKVATGGSLGLYSKNMTISPGGVLDVSALNPNGYYPQYVFNLDAGTASKPYTNFFGSYSPAYPGFVVTTSTNYSVNTTTNVTWTGSAYTTNLTYVTNFASYSYTSNSIVSIIYADVNGNFSLYGGSFTPVAPAPGFANFTVNGNLTLDNSLGSPNNLNFLLGTNTTLGGGVNDVIVVTNGTLNIGDTCNIIVSPAYGSLASGTYTLMTSPNLVTSGGDINGSQPANFVVIAQRGIVGNITTDSKNVYLSASGTATPSNIVWAATSTANNNWDVHVTQNWKNNGVLDYFYSGDGVIFNDSGFGTINLPSPVTPGSMTFNNNNTNYTFSANTESFIAGGAGITLNGSGTVTLNSPNAFTGPVTLNNGTLTLGLYGIANDYANQTVYDGVAPGQLVFGGNAILNLNDSVANESPFDSFAGLTLNPGANGQIATLVGRGANDIPEVTIGANLIRNVGSSFYAGNFALKANTGNNGIYFTNTIPWTNGLLGGGWAHVGNDWLLAQTNYSSSPNNSPASGNYNYVGYPTTGLTNWVSTNNIALTNVAFSITGSSNIYTLKLLGPVTLTQTAGTTLTLGSGGLLVSSAGTGASVISGGTLEGAAGADLIVLQNYTASPLTIGSVIADNGSSTALTLGGLGGTLILTNNNTYSGVTYVNAGSLQVGAGAALGSIANSSGIIDNGGTLTFNRPDSTSVGLISGLGGLTQAGTGTLTLTANNTLTGLLTISAGTVQVGSGGAAGSISNITSVVDSGRLVFNNSGTLGYGGVISGIGSVVQQGGTLILTNRETYSGNTIVSNGTLALAATASISNTAAIVVNAGAIFDASAAGGLTLRSAAPSEILAGGGQVNGSVTVGAGTKVTPGTNGVIGTLTFNNNLTVNGGNLVFDVTNSPGVGDQIQVGGVLNQNSGNVLINVVGTPLANGLYPLVQATGGLSGSANNLIAIGFLQSGQLAVLTNSTANELDLLVYSGIAPSLTWKGDGSQNLWDTTASSIWQGAALYQQGDYVTFDDSGSNTPPVNLDIVEYPASVTVNSTNENYTFGVNGGSGANRISGGTTLTKNGPGTLTLQTVNDYVGATTINGGAIQLNGDGGGSDDGMVGNGGNVTDNGALIINNANTETLAGSISGSGSLVQEGVGETILTGNNTAFAGPITFTNFLQVGNGIAGTLGTGNVTNNGTLIFNVSGSLPVNANIAGSGSVSNVAGTVTLNGTGTYAGSTAVAGGKIVLGSATALPSTGAVILNDGNAPVGTLDLDGNSFTVPSLTGNNTGQGNSTLNESLIVNNGSGTSILTISGNNTNTYNGQILDNNNAGSGKVGLAVVNGANFTLNSCYNAASAFPFANVFSGGITVSNATLSLGVNNGSATPGGVGTAAAGGNPNGTQTIVMTGTNDLLYAAAAGGSTTPTLQTTVGTLNVTTNTTAFIYGAQRGQFNSATLTGSGNIIYQPNYVRDRLTFGNASAFTGTITFEQHQNTSGGGIGYDGPLGFPNAPVIFGITNASFPTFYGSTTVGNGVVFPMGSLAGGDNTAELAGSSQNVGANVIYSIGGLNTSTTYGGLIVDAVGIRKVGTGSLTLTNNTLSWSGQTVVSNGTLAFAPLAVTNQALGPVYLLSSNYTLVSPGILDVSAAGGTLYLAHNNNGFQSLYGNGTLNGSLVASNSLIAPGRRASMSSIFTGSALTVTNTVTLHSGTTNLFGINRTNTPPNDSLAALSIAYAGTLIVTNFGDTNYASGSSNVFRLFSGALSGTFASVTLPVLPAGMYWVTNLYVDGSIAIVNTNSSISTNAFTITNSFNSVNGTLTLSWPLNHTGYRLEAQTNTLAVGISTNWVDIDSQFTPPANTTNQVAIPVYTGNASVFYRLIYP